MHIIENKLILESSRALKYDLKNVIVLNVYIILSIAINLFLSHKESVNEIVETKCLRSGDYLVKLVSIDLHLHFQLNAL